MAALKRRRSTADELIPPIKCNLRNVINCYVLERRSIITLSRGFGLDTHTHTHSSVWLSLTSNVRPLWAQLSSGGLWSRDLRFHEMEIFHAALAEGEWDIFLSQFKKRNAESGNIKEYRWRSRWQWFMWWRIRDWIWHLLTKKKKIHPFMINSFGRLFFTL